MVQSFIPNEADAGDANQAEVDSIDFQILLAGIRGAGVIEGCAPTDGASGLEIDIAEGLVQIDGEYQRVAAATVTPGAADGTNPRFDLVTVDKSGTLAVVAGTAAANPVYPAIPADEIVICIAYIDAGVTTLASADITDKRCTVTPGLPSPEILTTAVNEYYGPALEFYTTAPISSTVNNSNDRLAGYPAYLPRPITIDRVGVHVVTLCDGSATGTPVLRLGLYKMGANGRPGALVADFGTIDISSSGSTGFQEITGLSQEIGNPPGWYWFVAAVQDIQNSGVNPDFRAGGRLYINPWGAVKTDNNFPPVGYQTGSGDITGALPDPFSAASGNWIQMHTTSAQPPLVRVRRST